MSETASADQYLLEQVRNGDSDGWRQLVERYQGRLQAFARSRGLDAADTDDLVQDTFVRFLESLPRFRGDASLETWLFVILRRRLIDQHRGKRIPVCLAHGEDDPADPIDTFASDEATASRYARDAEEQQRQRQLLSAALAQLVGQLREDQDFRALQVLEMLFYAQLRNQQIAALSGLDEKHIALIKHRWLKRLRDQVQSRQPDVNVDVPDSLLTGIWEEQRPSCPKRSTLGGWLLGTLDESWQDYVRFHVEQLGCRFCRANVQDMQAQTQQAPADLRDRILQSTVGFFSSPSPGV